MTNPVEAVTVEHLKPCPNPWCNSGVRPMPFAMRTGGFTVICGCDFHGPNRDTPTEAIAAWNTRTQANEVMREALEEIANPIKAMQRRAQEEEVHLDGAVARRLAGDADYLRSIARRALSGGSA